MSRKLAPVILARSFYLPYELVKDRLPGWSITRDFTLLSRPCTVDFYYADGESLSDKRAYSVRARLRPQLNAPAFGNKAILHSILAKAAPGTICNTIAVSEQTELPPGTWVIRPSWGHGGQGVAFVSTNDEFRAAVRALQGGGGIVTNSAAACMKLDIIASEYIMDPMLYRGHKFHIRAMVIVLKTARDYTVWLVGNDGSPSESPHRAGWVAVAAEPYAPGDWSNLAIHDTHIRANRAMTTTWPNKDLPTVTVAAVGSLVHDVFTALQPHVKVFPESPAAYELLGLDIMFTADGTPKLIEINKYPTFMSSITFPGKREPIGFYGADMDAEWFDAVLGTAVRCALPDVAGDLGRPELATRII